MARTFDKVELASGIMAWLERGGGVKDLTPKQLAAIVAASVSICEAIDAEPPPSPAKEDADAARRDG